jgi:Carboxypeptidase regulatory-like domain
MRSKMRWILPLLLVVFGSGACFAQNTNSGDIRGTVTDQTGAVISGAKVSAKDIDKDVTTVYITDGAGLFDTGPIVPDHYLLTFTRDGFKTLVRGPVTLGVGIDTVNAQLDVGVASQQVIVNTDLPLLTTESGAQEGTLEAQTMADLPQVGGADWENFVILMPGASGAPENSSNSINPGQISSINGNLPFESVLADGATTTLPMSQNSDVTVFETTAEVKVSATAFSAQYGVGDIVYNQITKSGTDKFHGAAYEYFQNNALNAYPYEFGTPASQVGPIPVLRYNNFGGAVGGPVKPFKKIFFYFDYDRTINNSAGSGGFITVPDSNVLAGNFSAPGLPTLYDPTTQVIKTTGTCLQGGAIVTASAANPCVQRTAFQDETQYGGDHTHATNKIPASLISSTAQAIQKFYPSPNTAGTSNNGYNINNYHYSVPNADPFIKWFGRLDYDITPSNRLTVSETESDNPAQYLSAVPCPVNCQNGDVSRDNAQISDVWTFSSHLINEARLGFTDQMNFFTPFGGGEGWAGKLGMPMLVVDSFPNVGISDYYGLGSSSNSVYKEMVFDPSDVVTLIKGRHVLHLGGEFLINRADSTAWGNENPGSVNYTGEYTASGGQNTLSTDGFAYADFLLGQTNSWGANVTPEFGGRWKTPQMFVQDDWKVKPNLTVNLGLRYEIETGWREVKGNEKVFDPAVVSKDVTDPVGSGYGQEVQGGMWYGFIGQNGRTTLQAPKYDIILPRVGFSWELMKDTVLRGGIGMYASTWSEDTYGQGMGGAFGSSGGDSDSTNGMCPVVEIAASGQAPDTTDPGCGVGSFNGVSIFSTYLSSPTTPWAGQGLNQSATYNEYHTPVPKNYQWSIGVQRAFAKDFVGEVNYVGNHGTGLNFPVDIDQVPESDLQFGPNNQSYEPYPLYASITGSTNNAISNYHALQAVLTKRLTYGLQFSVNYTWSHFLDDLDSSGWGSRMGWQNIQNAYAPSQNYSQSNFDIRQMFKGEAIYKLPFGRGGMFLNDNALLDEVVGGWQLSATFMAQGGNPMGVTTGDLNDSYNRSGSYSQYANLTGDYKGTDPVTGNHYHSLAEWYNVHAFTLPAPGTYGTFRRNVIAGPDLTNVNFSFGKTFDLWPERNVKFQVRADMSNALNHPSFGQSGSNIVGCSGSNFSDCTSDINSTTVGGRAMQIYGRISF